MQKPHLRIQADSFGGGNTIAEQQHIEKGQERIHRVTGRTATASTELKGLTAFPYHAAKRTEMSAGGFSLKAAELVQIFNSRYLLHGDCQRVGRILQACDVLWIF